MAKRSPRVSARLLPNVKLPQIEQGLWHRWTARPWLPPLAIALVVLVAYIPAYRAGFVWDDDHHLTQNACLQSWDGLRAIWLDPQATPQYYPLVHTSFWLEHQLWGLEPAGYHVVNVLLHLAGAICLGLLLRRLAVPGAWLAAAIVAVHPVGVESVAWVTERKNVLSLLLYMAAMTAFVRALGLDASPQALQTAASSPCSEAGRFAKRHYAVGLALFVLALLSKTVTCSLPAAMLVLAWWKLGYLRRRDLFAMTPLMLLGLASAALTVCLEKSHVGATGTDWQLSISERLLVAGRAVWFYAGKLVWPEQLTFVYPRWELDATQAGQWMFPALAVGGIAALWAGRHRLGRGPLAGTLLFVGTLTPALGFFDVYPMRYSFVADHFQYLAAPALVVLIAGLGAWLFERCHLAGHPVASCLRAGAVLFLATLTWQRALVFSDAATLWRDTLAKNPQCWLAANNLANLLVREHKVAEALPFYQQAALLRPNDAETRINFGAALLLAGNPTAAVEELTAGVQLAPTDAGAYCNLARAEAAAGRASDADLSYERAVSLAPESADIRFNFGLFLLRLKRLTAADRELRAATRLAPDHLQAHLARAAALAQRGRTFEAIEEAECAQRLSPGNPTAAALLSQLVR